MHLTSVTLSGTKGTSDWVAADACTLPTSEQPLRMLEFDELFTWSLVGAKYLAGASSATLVLEGAADLPGLVRSLAAAESSCCSFFTFDVRASTASGPGATRVDLAVEVPAERVAVLDALVERAVVHGRLP